MAAPPARPSIATPAAPPAAGPAHDERGPQAAAALTGIEDVDVLVIGAGVVGLACARALAQAGRAVVVVDAADTHGTGLSSRNSEVLHAGLYYPPGSLRARLCVAGRRQLVDYCRDRDVQHRLCGKLVVARDDADRPRLDALHAQARACGVATTRRWSREDVRAAEPALDVAGALWSPDTGIVDGAALMLALRADAEAAGAAFVFRSPVDALALAGDGTLHATLGGDAPVRVRARAVVNAAGLHALPMARAMQGLPAAYAATLPAPRYARGAYFELAARTPFSHLVYPVPGASSHLGVHLTLDLAGRARFGPDFEWVDDPADLAVDPARAPAFEAAVRAWWPGLPAGALRPGFAGMRPKLTGPGEPAADFRIDGPAAHGAPGLVHLLGIESPGLTASMAIGDLVATPLGG